MAPSVFRSAPAVPPGFSTCYTRYGKVSPSLLFAHGAVDGDYEVLMTLRRQLEWYFSDASLSTDHFLHNKISEASPDGWLCCFWLMCCSRVKELRVTPQQIIDALKDSHLETKIVSKPDEEDSGQNADMLRRVFVRRRQPLPPLLPGECRGVDGTIVGNPEHSVLVDLHGTMNRLKDQQRVQESLGLKEVGDSTTVFRQHSRYACGAGSKISTPGSVIAVGYERVLYGDHGPYVELSKEQVRWEAWPHFFDKKRYAESYYDEYYTFVSHRIWQVQWNRWDPNPNQGVLMLYAQRHTVDDRRWAPGSAWTEGRANGYADYRPGYFYIAADESMIEVSFHGEQAVCNRSARLDWAGG